MRLCTVAYIILREIFYNDCIGQPLLKEDKMGTTMYNKIYLGRNPLLDSRRMQAALALGVLAGAGLVWVAVRAMK